MVNVNQNGLQEALGDAVDVYNGGDRLILEKLDEVLVVIPYQEEDVTTVDAGVLLKVFEANTLFTSNTRIGFEVIDVNHGVITAYSGYDGDNLLFDRYVIIPENNNSHDYTPILLEMYRNVESQV